MNALGRCRPISMVNAKPDSCVHSFQAAPGIPLLAAGNYLLGSQLLQSPPGCAQLPAEPGDPLLTYGAVIHQPETSALSQQETHRR